MIWPHRSLSTAYKTVLMLLVTAYMAETSYNWFKLINIRLTCQLYFFVATIYLLLEATNM